MLLLSTLAVLVAQRSTGPGPTPSPEGGALGTICGLVCGLIVLVGIGALQWWKVFEKAGLPAWASLVPIYNLALVLKIGGQNPLWAVLAIIPCLNFVFLVFFIMACIEIAKRFGQGAGFAVGLILLGIVFFPILGFGSYQYRGPAIAQR